VTGYTFLVWLHLVASVLVTGLSLFWAIMALALGRTSSSSEAARLFGIAASARWPHTIVPWNARVPLWLLGLVLVAVAAVTGLALGLPLTVTFAVKLVLVLALVVALAGLRSRGAGRLGLVCLVLALAITAVSTLLPR
jgi:hypothetical protein